MFEGTTHNITYTSPSLGDTPASTIAYKGSISLPARPNWEQHMDALEARLLAIELHLSSTPWERLKRFLLALGGKCRNLLSHRRTS